MATQVQGKLYCSQVIQTVGNKHVTLVDADPAGTDPVTRKMEMYVGNGLDGEFEVGQCYDIRFLPVVTEERVSTVSQHV